MSNFNISYDEFGTFYKIKLLYKNTIVIPNYRTTCYEKVIKIIVIIIINLLTIN